MNDLERTGPHQPANNDEPAVAAVPVAQPQRIGRYRVEKILGQGGFGLVYLAHDEQLQRLVAIKVPHRQLVDRPEAAEAYLTEARTVANLDHPQIVPVYDVGSTEDCPCYVVSKYIDGTDLATRLKQSRLSIHETVELVATVAEALHFAHKQGLVHRDIKPGNLLLDRSGKAFVADFGLALREQDIGKGPRYAGTPAYMSPEQARGEGHRVDGRSDIFSLGVVLYELLTGRRPYQAASPQELLEQITSMEARPPRQWDDAIPKELERICLKALSKRASERYTTAKDMGDDLQHFLGSVSVEELATVSFKPVEDAAVSTPSPTPSDQQAVKIVPKGLRSFDANDADFFLELLPGPRDREGLPDSIRFWKTRIETTDADNTFSVGLIYGPSGCGKSSLVNAGLLPRLAKSVTAVYVEATADETEARLLKGLRRQVPDLPANIGLIESLAAVRHRRFLDSGQKVLLVLDQFEQWLHAKRNEENTELVQALRQCDGGGVQCVVMVRDDFWLAVSRFLKELEIRLVEGQNSALADLFDMDHARKVLAAFGRAFGKLPEIPGETSKDQKEFLNQAVSGLAQDGKIICVRLALFAEMMKGKAWTPATLKEVGGTEGVGVTFLEETFSAATAPPEHRYHQKAARAVLKSLLPESGSDIKGHMRSHAELLAASGYANRPRDFDDLLRILDSEIRLLTPTDPEGKDDPDEPGGVSPRSPSARYYQLTHDYLVPSLRDWLTRKQKETRRGRAELLLADRAVVWNARPENRQLPSLLLWLQIRWLTQKKNWTSPQRKMMRQARWYHAQRGLAATVMLMVLVATGLMIRSGVVEQQKATHAEGLVHRLLDADIAQVPMIVSEIEPNRQWADRLLRDENDRAAASSREKLHTSLALLPVDPGQVDYLYGRLLGAAPNAVPVIRDFLAPYKDDLLDKLWAVAEAPEKGKESQRLRAAAALAMYDPESERWARVREDVANDLVTVPAVYLALWMDSLRPVRAKLLAPLKVVYRGTSRRDVERSLATDILADYAADQPELLADLVMDADDKQFAVLFPKVKGQEDQGSALLHAELDKRLQPKWTDAPLNPSRQEPAAALIQQIEAGQGFLTERFAFTQTMRLRDFLTVAEGLRSSGYRPIRFRPYRAGKDIQVAAVWTRDGLDWQLAHSLSAEEMRKRDAEQHQQGFRPVDVSGYLHHEENGPTEHYAAVWVKSAKDAALAHLEVGLENTQLKTKGETLRRKGFRLTTLSQFTDRDGEARFCEIWVKATDQTGGDHGQFDMIQPSYSGDNYLGELQVDAQVYKSEPPASTQERFTQQLNEAEKKLEAKPNDTSAQYQRAVTNFTLGENDKAVEDLSLLLKTFPKFAPLYRYRAISYARLGKAKEAKADLAKFQELSTEASLKAPTDAVVAVHLGEDTEGMKKLEAAITAHARESAFLYQAACAYAIASQVVSEKEMTKAKLYAERAIALLKEAVANGYSDYAQMQAEPDFDSLGEQAGFADVLATAKLDRRYAAVWHISKALTSREVHGLDPAGQLSRCRELISQGYRPASLSVADVGAGQSLVTASVWHRPVVPEEDKELLAKRQANAAVALLRMNQAEKVWPLLKHSPDPRVRSYLIHRLSTLGADTGAILKRLDEHLKRLDEEPDVTEGRALLLSLGEFGEKEFSLEARKAVLTKVKDIYEAAADPGLHGSAEWLLRKWEQEAWLKQDNEKWAKDKEQREKASRAALAPGAKPQWYVNGQGQSMVVIPGPVTFVMGSPSTEAGRYDYETQHKKRIARTFALAAKSVTVEQYRKFDDGYNLSAVYTRRADLPVVATSWYQAAAYCNWLSKEEGIPEEQWCYDIKDEIRLKRNEIKGDEIKLKANYLSLTGYRLPTEAEMEYATRAGALTSRYFGETEELLPKYAWYNKNAQEKTWPVGSLKPNDFGLFDMQGNVFTWCQERYKSYPQGQGKEPEDDKEDSYSINIQNSRVLRGGSFFSQASNVRSANRNYNVPASRDNAIGFRPARTFR